MHSRSGEAHARARATGVLLERLVDDTKAIVERGSFTLDERLDLKLRAGYLCDLCREGMNSMMARSGTRSFRLEAPLQRFFRDMNALTSHAFFDWETCRELFGRHRVGLEPNHPLF